MSQVPGNNIQYLDDSLLTALVAGVSSAALTGVVTYPLDFLKTQAQINNYKSIEKFKIPSNSPHTLGQLYKGCSALVIGNVLKSAVRLFLYHWLSNFMALESIDSKGNHVKKTTAPRIVIAGIMGGFIESLCIIPFENIKITMIQNMSLQNELTRLKDAGSKVDVTGYLIPGKHHKPSQNIFTKQYISPHAYFTSEVLAQYKGMHVSKFGHSSKFSKYDAVRHKYNQHPSLTFWSTVKEIYTLKGVRGFMYGGLITIFRQTAISGIWFSSYNSAKQILLPHYKAGEGLFSDQFSLVQLVGLQVAASAAVIATTQPVDVIKTHMQLKNSHTAYRDSLSTAYRLALENGVLSLYRGTAPRAIKVFFGGVLSSSLYGYFESLVNSASNKTVFSSE